MARILVVDDEPDVRELFNITLKMAGHVTDTAQDGQEAVDRLKQELPDLILLDLMMPRLDGFGFLAHVRKELDTKPIRVLIATAKVLEDADHERLNSWPVVGVLNKGELDIAQMVVIVSSALSKNPLKNGKDIAGSPAGGPVGEPVGKPVSELSARPVTEAAARPAAKSEDNEAGADPGSKKDDPKDQGKSPDNAEKDKPRIN